VMRKLADSHRVLVASPDYLDRRGRPKTPADLAQHEGLRSIGWDRTLAALNRERGARRHPSDLPPAK
jgi:DNA-binding transcriptional LysR family regulator